MCEASEGVGLGLDRVQAPFHTKRTVFGCLLCSSNGLDTYGSLGGLGFSDHFWYYSCSISRVVVRPVSISWKDVACMVMHRLFCINTFARIWKSWLIICVYITEERCKDWALGRRILPLSFTVFQSHPRQTESNLDPVHNASGLTYTGLDLVLKKPRISGISLSILVSCTACRRSVEDYWLKQRLQLLFYVVWGNSWKREQMLSGCLLDQCSYSETLRTPLFGGGSPVAEPWSALDWLQREATWWWLAEERDSSTMIGWRARDNRNPHPALRKRCLKFFSLWNFSCENSPTGSSVKKVEQFGRSFFFPFRQSVFLFFFSNKCFLLIFSSFFFVPVLCALADNHGLISGIPDWVLRPFPELVCCQSWFYE